MTENKEALGAIEWRDLTVHDAELTKNFYEKVVGWKTEPVSMGDYNDFNVNLPESNETIAGICHARGDNAGLPPQWLMYVRVASVQDSVQKCLALGGKVINGPKALGSDQFCIVQDPAGAVLALVSK